MKLLNIDCLIKSRFCRGINVLNNKTELERAFAKHKKNLDEKQKEQEKTETFNNEFQKMLADRAKRLERLEKVCFVVCL